MISGLVYFSVSQFEKRLIIQFSAIFRDVFGFPFCPKLTTKSTLFRVE
jgi:hypothetical protein